MHDVIGSLGGFRGLRAELLVLLKKAQPLTAAELGAHFGLTPNALRRHLKVLEEDGVVRYQREVRGVGAPVFAYRLSEAGEAVFPRRYATVLATALEALSEEQGERAVATVLAREWDALALEAEPVLAGLPLAERVQLVAELLTARGYMAEGEVLSDNAARLRIHNCAMCEIAERFPAVCDVEAQQLARLLDAPVARQAHRFDGCGSCAYEVGVTAGPAGALDNDRTDDPTAVGVNATAGAGLTAWDEEQA
jgi:DeoR family suf operon transcriptional repressor